MSAQVVLYHREQATGIITFNRPHRLNAINLDLLREFMSQLERAKHDKDAKVIVLTGEGRSFCAGEDLKETVEEKDLETWVEEADRLQEVERAVLRLGKPLIAAVRGYALGGGCEFAMACDMRIASEDAIFGFPETGVGLTVTTGGTKLLTQLVGLGKAKELILTGEFIDAQEALRIGLVNKVVPGDALMKEAMAMAEKISNRSPLALRLSRIAIDQGLDSSMEQTLEMEANHLLLCVQSQDQKKYVRRRLSEMKKEQRGNPHYDKLSRKS